MSGGSDFEMMRLQIFNLLEQLKLETKNPDTLHRIEELKIQLRGLVEL